MTPTLVHTLVTSLLLVSLATGGGALAGMYHLRLRLGLKWILGAILTLIIAFDLTALGVLVSQQVTATVDYQPWLGRWLLSLSALSTTIVALLGTIIALKRIFWQTPRTRDGSRYA